MDKKDATVTMSLEDFEKLVEYQKRLYELLCRIRNSVDIVWED